MGGPAFFSTLVGQAGEQELCQESCLHIFRQAPKNLLGKALHEKSKILIKGGVSKLRYFQHACQSGADQFTYPIERCLHLACIHSLAEQQTPR